jgi:hypothetical protein
MSKFNTYDCIVKAYATVSVQVLARDDDEAYEAAIAEAETLLGGADFELEVDSMELGINEGYMED